MSIRVADYSKPETFLEALKGIKKVLLISSTDVGKRLGHHQAVIDAAKQAGTVELFAYTSILKGENSSLPLAPEHVATEKAIKASGLPYVFLRNGW